MAFCYTAYFHYLRCITRCIALAFQFLSFFYLLDQLYSLQDIEFTVENKVLHILQTRTAKRTARAGVCVAVAMVKERLISEREALLRTDAAQMDFFLHAMVDKEFGEYVVDCLY